MFPRLVAILCLLAGGVQAERPNILFIMSDDHAAVRKVGETKITKSENPTFRCMIRGDREATPLSVSLAMNAATEAGISDISFSTVNRE